MSGNQQDPDMICEVFVLAENNVFDWLGIVRQGAVRGCGR